MEDFVTVHIPLQKSNSKVRKKSTDFELPINMVKMGSVVSLPWRGPRPKKGTVLAIEVPPCEVTHATEPVKEETLRSLSAQDIELIQPGKTEQDKTRKTNITDLPEEVQQHILGYLAGHLRSISSNTLGYGVRNWHHALRHTRDKACVNLALVTPLWTRLIQERLYRHSQYHSLYLPTC